MGNFHLHEEEIYLISNHAVARNSIFHNPEIRERFQKKMLDYLEPVSNILAYSIKGHEFRILLRLKRRSEIEDFYIDKRGEYNGIEELPLSTHIFSQQMSNLQVSLVKHYNSKFNRSGTLMAGRFQRRLIISETEVLDLVDELGRGAVSHSYSGIWAEMGVRVLEGLNEQYIKFGNKGGNKYAEFKGTKIDLVEQFLNTQNLKNYPPPIFCKRRFFRSLCKYHE